MPKRVLSYTILERKIRLIFGLMILLIIVALFFLPWHLAESAIYEQDELAAREMAGRHLRQMHLEIYDPEAAEQLETLTRIGLPAAREDAEPTQVITPPDDEGQPPDDPVLREWLETLDAGEMRPMSERSFRKDEGYFFRYGYPFYAGQGCVDCHGTTDPDLEVGDLMGVAVVSFPIDEARDRIRGMRVILIATALVAAVLSMVVFYAVVRLVIVQPVAHLKTVADRVTEGDLDVRADIQTGDEFEELGASLNRMLSRLDASREELRRANQSLDHKLDELAQANVSLFEMNQVKSKFLTTMSHELRTPLNAILGFADVLADHGSVREDAKLNRYVDNIRNSGRLLLDLINDLLDLAKIEAGKMTLKLDRVSPLDVCETSMNMVRPMVGRKPLRLVLEIDPDSPIMTTDSNKLQQVLYNLLSNAVKFTDEGTVTLRARPIDAGTMLFQAADTGPGLSREQQRAVFDRFSQVDQGHTRKYSGTGLGLSIVKELVELMGGDVAVVSELGEGATFNVTLPVICRPTETREPDTASSARGAPSNAIAPGDTVTEGEAIRDDLQPGKVSGEKPADNAPETGAGPRE